MGYISTMSEFKQLSFYLVPGVTKESILEELSEDARDELGFWFEIEVDEDDGELRLVPQGEPGKGYYLEEALKELLALVNPLQKIGSSDLPGLRISFEFWGEESGDFGLYGTDDEGLYFVRGVPSFSGDKKRL